MAEFRATEAAFEGFRIARERPIAILTWAVILLFTNLAGAGLLIGTAGPQLAALQAQQASGATPDPNEMFASLGALVPAYLGLLALTLVIYAVLYAAIFRIVLRPSDGGTGFLRLGGDELRQGLALLIGVLILTAAYIGFALVAGLIGGLLGAISPVLGGIAAAVLIIGGLCFLIWIAVKLSLFPAATFVRRKLDLGGAWAATRGRFWPLLGAYVLAVVFLLLVYLLAIIVFAGIAAVLTGGDVGAVGRVMSPDMSSLAGYFTPVMLLYLVFTAVVGALGLAITVSPSAVAYRDIAGVSEADVFA